MIKDNFKHYIKLDLFEPKDSHLAGTTSTFSLFYNFRVSNIVFDLFYCRFRFHPMVNILILIININLCKYIQIDR